jgi:hypothetical protein
MAALTCSYVRTGIVIPPATPTTINVGINNASQWLCVVKNSGANPVTAITLSTSPLGQLFEASFALDEDLPLAAGASLPGIRGCGEPVLYLRLVVTSSLGTTLDINAAG